MLAEELRAIATDLTALRMETVYEGDELVQQRLGENVRKLRHLTDHLDLVARQCTHNEMVANPATGFAWKCVKCGYVYGTGAPEANLTANTGGAT